MQENSKVVLVVENDKFLANAYRIKCQNEDFEVLVASDGNEALRILEEKTPNVILLDLVMPNKDGFEFMAEVNKDPELKKIPILITSNLEQEEDVKKAMSMGAKDYVIKSDTPLEEILEKIRQYL